METEHHTLLRSAKLLLAVTGILFVSVMWLLKSNTNQDDFLKKGREQRISYQAERMYLQCKMIEDDAESLPQADVDHINDICQNYNTPEQALRTELDR